MRNYEYALTLGSIITLFLSQSNNALPLPKSTSRIVPPQSLCRSYHCITTSIYQHRRQKNYLPTTTSLKLSSSPNLILPLISKNDSWGNIASICAVASASHKLGQTSSIGRLLGPPVTAMAIAFLLGSVGFLPAGGSPATKALQLLCIQLATPLLLFGVNIKECRQRCGPLLLAFVVASMGTMIAAFVAYPICGPLLHKSMGIDGLKIAAALMAKNVGGGLNYIAVCRSLSASPSAIAAGLCVDNIFALIYFPVTSALAAGKPDPNNNNIDGVDINQESFDTYSEGDDINPETMSAAIAFSTLITWLGGKLGGQAASLPLSTLFTILFTTIFSKTAKSLSATGEILGTSLLYIFFATAGAPGLSIAQSVRSSFLPISLFLGLLYGIHGITLYLVRNAVLFWDRKVQRYDNKFVERSDSFVEPSRLLVASSAAIGGPATAAALAKANKWHSLVAPSLIVGNLGYAVATFAGIAFHKYFSSFH